MSTESSLANIDGKWFKEIWIRNPALNRLKFDSVKQKINQTIQHSKENFAKIRWKSGLRRPRIQLKFVQNSVQIWPEIPRKNGHKNSVHFQSRAAPSKCSQKRGRGNENEKVRRNKRPVQLWIEIEPNSSHSNRKLDAVSHEMVECHPVTVAVFNPTG